MATIFDFGQTISSAWISTHGLSYYRNVPITPDEISDEMALVPHDDLLKLIVFFYISLRRRQTARYGLIFLQSVKGFLF